MPNPDTDRLFMWAGGKTKLLPYYQDFLPGDVRQRSYHEPFAGGAALFNFLSSKRRLSGILSDVNGEVMDLYRLVRDDPEFLIGEMTVREAAWMPLEIPARKALYYELRQAYWDMPEGPEATALLYFLMKTGFNGIWQTCQASRGRFGTPVGLAGQKTKVFDPDVVRAWSRKLAGMDLVTGSYEQIEIGQEGFVFCDPPYRESFTTYGTAFDDSHQVTLIDWCRDVHVRTGSVVWLSNREAGDGFFETHAPDARMHRFPVTYTAGRRKRTQVGFEAKPATEVLLIWE